MAISNEPNLEKIRQILLEPDLSELSQKVTRVENKIAEIASRDTDALRAEVAAVKDDISNIKKEIEEVKNVLVGFNRKLTKAFAGFTTFVKPGEGES